MEFKYTEPIIPTAIQKIIYGSSLEEYLSTEIIGKTLIEKIENKPEIIFVDSQELLSLENVVFLAELKTPTEESLEINNRYFKIIPLKENIKSILTDISEKIDITEPFSRLEKALNYVCES
ncbi:hypothetical protein H17ap60334_06064 [Thermosipho africanus H17ap60334]|uniref:hypothetical protein n=1 Tax=Thermosipho africanus TaxID=2421 RepID=UPI00028BFECA|nr:hypothetical protein [Thermosipho africanus]EKF49321.1 hypothetical protein H17ap60334_06064 [Thermosipho africanus H17ap60334]